LNLKQEWPAFAIQIPESGVKFPFDQSKDISESNIEKFVTDYVNGKLSPSIKSAPIPEKNDEPVKVIVADQFDEIVLDKSKNVFVEFYAPWCGHCKVILKDLNFSVWLLFGMNLLRNCSMLMTW
jgi:protein disulfide-isomerase A1